MTQIPIAEAAEFEIQATGVVDDPRLMSWRSWLATQVYRGIGAAPWPPVPEAWTPMFLIGCGRSGTTILGELLSQHPAIVVLNEPRHIWRAVLPASDIWYFRQQPPPAKLVLSGDDIDGRGIARSRRMFYVAQRLARKRLLVEKLPANAFRLPWLRRIFPHARFLHLVRHGLEVAHSIAREGNRWYAPNGEQGWRLLREYALSQGYDSARWESSTDPRSRGLLEWTLSVSACRAFGRQLDPRHYREIRYEDLIENPAEVVATLEGFLGLPPSTAMRAFAQTRLTRRSEPAETLELPEFVEPRTLVLMSELGYAWPDSGTDAG